MGQLGFSPRDEVDEKPWKYIGYNGYSSFLATDTDFCNFRRFDRLNIRVILALQDELVEIEESLAEIDRASSRRDAPDLNNGSFRDDPQRVRADLVWEARHKLEEYSLEPHPSPFNLMLRIIYAHTSASTDRYICRYIKLRTRAPATEKDIKSLRNWHYNCKEAISEKESQYIEKDDLFALIPKERAPLRRLFERSSCFRFLALWQRKQAPTSLLPLHIRKHVHYSSAERIDQFVTATTVFAGLVMIITPIWILAFTKAMVLQLTFITIFILLFLALVSFGTNAKPYEALAATAAYSAILMVFLQFGSKSNL
ncbi:hypothetical protein BJX62DRAFT_231109 [Aspergillus germanicus]